MIYCVKSIYTERVYELNSFDIIKNKMQMHILLPYLHAKVLSPGCTASQLLQDFPRKN